MNNTARPRSEYILLALIVLAGLTIRLLLFCGDGLGDDPNYFAAFKNIHDGHFLNSQYYHRFSFWIPMVLLWKLLGISEFTFILPVLLSSLGCIGLIYAIGKELFNREAGLIAAALMAFNPFEVLNSTVFSTDMNLSLYILCSVYFFLLAQRNYRHIYFFLSALFLVFSFANKPLGIYISVVLPVLALLKDHRPKSLLRYWPFVLWAVLLFGLLLGAFWILTGDPFIIINIYFTKEPQLTVPIDPNHLLIYPKQMFFKNEFGEWLHGFHFYAVALCFFFLRRRDGKRVAAVSLWFLIMVACIEFLPHQIVKGEWQTSQRIFRYFVIVVPPSILWLAYFWMKGFRHSPRIFYGAFAAYLALSIYGCWDSTRVARIAFGEVREAIHYLKALGNVDIYSDDYFTAKFQRLTNRGEPIPLLHGWIGPRPADAWMGSFVTIQTGYIVTGGARLPYYGCFGCIPILGQSKPPASWTLVKEYDAATYPPWKTEPLRIWKVSLCDQIPGIVQIPDPQFDLCLREKVFPLRPQDGLAKNQPILRSRACLVTRLECESLGIRDATGLENFTNLTILNLNHNQLTRVDVSLLTRLEMLLIGHNRLIDVGDLGKLTQLHTVWLGYNQFRSINVGGLNNLRDLRLDKNRLSAVTGIKNLPRLEMLFLSGNPDLNCSELNLRAELLASSGCGQR